MLSSILIAVTIACLITAVTVFISITMCLHFRRKKKHTKEADEESTLQSFPVQVRKLTIDHGNVVTAPSSPRMTLARFSQPMTAYAPSTRRESNMTAVQSPTAKFSFFPKPSLDTSAPSSPRSNMSSVSPTSTRHGRSHPSQAVPMPERAWLESISSLSHPGDSAAEAERLYRERRAAINASVSTSDSGVQLLKPEVAVTSDQIYMDTRRKASLGAISQAVTDHSRTSSTSSPRLSEVGSPRQVPQQRSRSASAGKTGGSPVIDVNIPTPTVSAVNTPRSSVYTTDSAELRRTKSDKPRRPRPPPITTSMQPPKVPDTFLTSPTDTIATVQAIVPDDRESSRSMLQPARPDTRASRSTRQSVLSFTSSQYSPTFSIKPVEQVQIMQSMRPQQVIARSTTSPVIPGAQQTPKPIFPADHSISKSSQYNTSIEGRIDPDSRDTPRQASAKAKKLPLPPLLDRSVSAPDSYDVPLTSASISFPPNLPDYNFSPVDGSQADKEARLRQGSAPQIIVPRPLVSPKVGAQVNTTGVRRKPELKHSRSDVVTIAELPSREDGSSPTSLKGMGLRGTATVSISELAAKAHMERTRQRVERVTVVRQHSG